MHRRPSRVGRLRGELRRGRQRWLLDYPHDDRAGEVQDTLDAQLKDYPEMYGGVLGFGYLVLGR